MPAFRTVTVQLVEKSDPPGGHYLQQVLDITTHHTPCSESLVDACASLFAELMKNSESIHVEAVSVCAGPAHVTRCRHYQSLRGRS